MEQMSPKAQLKQASLRVTSPRLAVMDALAQSPHQNAEAVAEVARARLGTLSMQSVYDNLGALVEAGIARRIEPAGSAALYELRSSDNHHHLVCRECGGVQDVDCAKGKAPCLHPSDTHGFDIDEAEVTFWGVCSNCQTK